MSEQLLDKSREVRQMELVAGSSKLGRVLCNRRLLVKEYGSDCAKRIQVRLNELSGVNSLYELSPSSSSHCHKLHGEFAGKFAVDVSKNFRMIFEGYDLNNQPVSDRSKIVTIEILDVCDYH